MHDKTIRFPETKTLVLDQQGVILHVGLNRPEVRNAMSAQMVCELAAVFNMIKSMNRAQGFFDFGAAITYFFFFFDKIAPVHSKSSY